ncbi:MAG: metallopeptidase family protein [Patescibacteria group bacterium]|jgi:predicted Zn-dependent protease with MMP-like domain
MELQEFEEYVKQAVEKVPLELRKKIENLAFVVEEDVRNAQSNEKYIKSGRILLGLYQGVPLTKRSGYYSGVLPDKITIFKRSIELIAGADETKVKRLIFSVVHHEIGHYFGMDEASVRNWEKKRKLKQ